MGEGGEEGKAQKPDEAKGTTQAEDKVVEGDLQEKKAEERAQDYDNVQHKTGEEASKPNPTPPDPLILQVNLHCFGCASKIRTSLLKIRGVEDVEVDMDQNQVKIKGVVNPETLCNQIRKKTKRRATVISPPSVEGCPLPKLVFSQVSGLTTVDLNVYMHCEACARELQRKILKMRGVQTVVAEPSSGKVTVTGSMDPNELAEYVYERTKKQAQIIPQLEPEPEPKPEPMADHKPEPVKQEPEEIITKGDEPEDAKEEKKGGDDKAEEGKDTNEEEKANHDQGEEPKKDLSGFNDDDVGKDPRPIYAMNYDYHYDEEIMKRMRFNHPQPIYIIERNMIPPPQLFSDENPNSCSIS